jgi:hypothetical protein
MIDWSKATVTVHVIDNGTCGPCASDIEMPLANLFAMADNEHLKNLKIMLSNMGF